jgi:predicted nucleic acid-binding protein
MISSTYSPSGYPPVVVIDASAWVSNLQSHDSNHIATRRWVDRHLLNGGLLVAPVLLVTETASALARATGQPNIAQRAVAQLYSMREMRLVPIDQPLVDEATTLAAGLGIRGADSFYVAVAKSLGIALVTFDHEQLTRPGTLITTIRP